MDVLRGMVGATVGMAALKTLSWLTHTPCGAKGCREKGVYRYNKRNSDFCDEHWEKIPLELMQDLNTCRAEMRREEWKCLYLIACGFANEMLCIVEEA